VNVRILKERKSHYEGQELDVVKRSSIEIPLKEGFQMYGGAKWLTIGYEDQLKIKEGQVREAFYHILKYFSEQDSLISSSQEQIFTPSYQPIFHPIIPSPEIY
jgi:tRNA/tmRNA/rRNA uracil-C5-methylase (TrmA/RlmC/RlmD family)